MSMAIFMRAKKFLSISLYSLTRSERCNGTLGERSFQAELYSHMAPAPNPILLPIDTSKWKKIQARKVGISASMISYPSWIVLDILRKEGFEAYLVGGCVRDLILNRIPKDFDVITTANLSQVKKKFHRSQIIGKRFPICTVHVKGSTIEVSSFKTVAKHEEDREEALSSLIPKRCDEKELIRWRNSMHRDFTINSLFFDPFTGNIYDYNDAMSDLKSLKLRTVIPAHVSFQEDCARILRGLRIAARLGFSFSMDTEKAMHDLSDSIGGLDKFRLMLETNYMLSYGAAVPSICLLQRFNLLDILLPFQAAYINRQRSAKSSMMLMKLFFNLDKLVSCDHPADSILWVGLLMFHLALVNNPQDALVVWTFASVLYHGKWTEGVEFVREQANLKVQFVPEISGFSKTKSDDELAKEVAQFASRVQDSFWALTDPTYLLESMSRCSYSPCSGLVFIPKSTARRTAKLFDMMVEDISSFINRGGRTSPEINYHLLGIGNPCETRYVLGKIMLETMKAGPIVDARERDTDEKDLQPKAIEENLVSNQSPVKKDKKRALSLSNADGKGGMPKKRKMVDKNQIKENISKKQMEVVEKSKHHIAPHAASKVQRKVVREFSLSRDKMDNLEKVSRKEGYKKIGSISEKEIGQERTVVKEEKSKKVKENISKKQMEVVEKSKHHIAPHAASKEQRKVVREFSLSRDKMDNLEKVSRKEGYKKIGSISEKEIGQERRVVKEEKSKKVKENISKKQMEVVEKSKHHIAPHAATKEQRKVVREFSLSRDKMDNFEKVSRKEGYKKEAMEKTEQHKGTTGKKRSGVSLLSSLFKRSE